MAGFKRHTALSSVMSGGPCSSSGAPSSIPVCPGKAVPGSCLSGLELHPDSTTEGSVESGFSLSSVSIGNDLSYVPSPHPPWVMSQLKRTLSYLSFTGGSLFTSYNRSGQALPAKDQIVDICLFKPYALCHKCPTCKRL